jgi:nucleoside-diphosphate-sugar epimerase
MPSTLPWSRVLQCLTCAQGNPPSLQKAGVSNADVMYIEDAIEALVLTLEAVAGPHTEVYVAHGRYEFRGCATLMSRQEG